ncbi:MAG: LCP family protein [Candidatus Caenarcaniphilales bacterium]|nr:LCP family protein [Candidatus Caenarcaniphilales bacterium]
MKTLFKYLLFVVLGIGLTLAAWRGYHTQSKPSKDLFPGFELATLPFYNLTEPKIVLIAGTDEEYDWSKGYAIKKRNTFKGRTDTLMVAKFDPLKRRLSVLSIPRDTRILIYGRSPEKINALNTYGGPDLLKKIVGELLDLKVDHYLMINSAGIEKMINEAGGLEIEVSKKMKYRDRTDGLDLDLEPGKQILSGKQAVGFIRFRHDELGDIGRIQRQQAFIHAAKHKLSDPALWTKIPTLMNMAQSVIKTDLSQTELIELATFVKDLPRQNQVFATLPGDFSIPPEPQVEVVYEDIPSEEGTLSDAPSPDSADKNSLDPDIDSRPKIRRTIVHQASFISYWIPHKPEVEKVVERLFGDLDSDEDLDPHKIKIAIENTTQDREVVNMLSRRLKEEGFPIVDIAQQRNGLKKQKSVIHAQKGNLSEARLLRRLLKLPKDTPLIASSLGSPLSDLTIVIGSDLETMLKDPPPQE